MPNRIPQVCLIFAVDKNNVLGRDNDIPWKSSHDFRWFRATTLGYNIAMGRKTWESLPKRPLPGRTNYVISSNPEYDAPGAIVVSSVEEAIARCQKENPQRMVYILGGKRVLEEAARYAEIAHISRVDVATEVDECCVLGPDLPPYEVTESYQLFAGDEKEPPVLRETIRFLDDAEVK
jgi:dihydrofolate reductase